jgi:phage shock protein PspC (stress-responsive transcriptional regulator)
MQRTDKLLRKSRQRGGVILGLCAGIGAHLGYDPVLVRFVLLLLVALPTAGLSVALLYVIFGLCLPVESDSEPA